MMLAYTIAGYFQLCMQAPRILKIQFGKGIKYKMSGNINNENKKQNILVVLQLLPTCEGRTVI